MGRGTYGLDKVDEDDEFETDQLGQRLVLRHLSRETAVEHQDTGDGGCHGNIFHDLDLIA